MLSKQERLIWIFVLLLSTVITYTLTKSLVSHPTLNQSFQTVTPNETISAVTSFECIEIRDSIMKTDRVEENWFSNLPTTIPNRLEYEQSLDNEREFCYVYREAVKSNQTFILKSAIDVANKRINGNTFEFPGETITAIYSLDNEFASILILRTLYGPEDQMETETRLDMKKYNEIWFVKWIGFRFRCYKHGQNPNEVQWVKEMC